MTLRAAASVGGSVGVLEWLHAVCWMQLGRAWCHGNLQRSSLSFGARQLCGIMVCLHRVSLTTLRVKICKISVNMT